jgi:hypothetical protein
MPYHHKKCNGIIKWYPPLPIPPRCTKCGKRWNPLVLYGKPPKDMTFQVPEIKTPQVKKGKTSYMSWADNFPVAAMIASHLPNWPRPVRIAAFIGLLIIAILLITKC